MTNLRHKPTSSLRVPKNFGTVTKPQRSAAWAIITTLIGWIVVAAPVAATSLLSYLLFISASGESNPTAVIFQGLLSGAMTICMIAFPVLLGLALMKRHRGLWISAIITAALSVATLIYISFVLYGSPTVAG